MLHMSRYLRERRDILADIATDTGTSSSLIDTGGALAN